MTVFSFYQREKSIYPNFYYRFCASLIVAHFIVSFGEEPNFFELLFLPHYYTALAGSFIISLTISEFIYLLHQHFERKYLWRSQIKTRVVVQASCGFVFSSILAVLLASIYFKLNDKSIFSAGYFKYDFTVVLCFIALVNFLYVIISLFELKLLPNRKNFSSAKLSVEEQVKRDIPAVIYSEQKHCYALQFDGHKFNWSMPIKESVANLPDGSYFQINRSTILHWKIISHYRPSESNTLKVFLKVPFKEVNYFVSQRNAVLF